MTRGFDRLPRRLRTCRRGRTRNGRGHASCIVHGRGEERLTVVAGVPGFIGLAAGRTVFWDPLVNWRAGKITREAAAGEIAGRYRNFAATFEAARAARKAPAS
jgi:hypothetical protein